MVKTLGTILKEVGLRVDNPAIPLKRVPINKQLNKILSREELEALLVDVRKQGKRASVEASNFITFLAFSGMRIGELQALKWSDVGNQFITVRGRETNDKNKAGTKNKEVRQVPIIPRLQELIDSLREEDSSGNVFYMKSPRGALDNACERLGFPHQRIHDLRHFFATMCIEQGIEIPTVAKWLGHKDGGALALRVYGHLRDEHSLAQAAKIV
jgi:integrase